MARKEKVKSPVNEELVYRVSTVDEWDELQRTDMTNGRDIDRQTGCIHLSSLHLVKMVLKNFYQGREDLFLLQIDTSKLGEGLVYEADDGNMFPHFYGPNMNFSPLQLNTITKQEKLALVNGEFTCRLLK